MATGDLRNNLKNLQAELKLMKYPETIDLASLSSGVPSSFLPIFHFAFTSFDAKFTKELVDMNIELYGKTDFQFMEGIYKVLRDVFSFKPPISKQQFFSPASFVEQKVIMCTKILQLVQAKSKKQQTSKNSKMKVSSSLDSLARLTAPKPQSRPKTAESKEGLPPRSKTNRMSFGGQKLSGRNQMQASGSHHSLMLPPREPPKPKDSVILGECRTPKQAWKYTPSVKNIESISAVINNPQDEIANSTLNDESQIEMVDIIASTPCKSIPGPVVKQDAAEIESLKAQMSKMQMLVDELTNRVMLLEVQNRQPPCCQTCQDSKHQLILLQNEMALVKASQNIGVSKSPHVDLPKSPYITTTVETSPSTLQNDSLSGSIVSVEGVVNGESKVQRMARAAEAKIKSLSETDSFGQIFSPIRAFDKSVSHVATNASPDCVGLAQANGETGESNVETGSTNGDNREINEETGKISGGTGRTSTPNSVFKTPTEPDDDLPIDQSTLEKVNKIKQLLRETEAMLPKTDVSMLPKTDVSS